ncbi:unnamed protein product [Prorocentrum cordatum]|uniref:Globin family profile domain-containing protein n=1 Tax=Prorocentrum cordatum TaxID=2364126 RepID=A0ABN9XQZ9_9DINO|nr:unnamed protein product [Polarella glacialis]
MLWGFGPGRRGQDQGVLERTPHQWPRGEEVPLAGARQRAGGGCSGFDAALQLRQGDVCPKPYNVPAYGPNISSAVMDIFTLEEIKKVFESLEVPIPPCNLSKFVQDKAVKVLDMVEYCEKTPAIAHNSAGATQKLIYFIEKFKELDPSITTVADGGAFVNRHANLGRQANLHADYLLDNFGFDKEASDLLRKTGFEKADGENVNFEQHAFRWLSKAFGAYGPEGLWLMLST